MKTDSMKTPAVPLIRATGDPFDLGHEHGSARAGQLRAFIDDDLCRINKLAPELTRIESLRPVPMPTARRSPAPRHC